MPIELKILGLAALLQCVQLILMAVPVNRQLGVDYTAGPRDEPRQATGTAGRLVRAYNNHFEALVLFAIAVLVVLLGEGGDRATATCAWVYLVARVLYVPAYVRDIFLLRSAIWAVGFLATVALLVMGLF